MRHSPPLPQVACQAASLPKVSAPATSSRLAGLVLAVAERFGLNCECRSTPPPARGGELLLTIGAAKVRLRLDEAGVAWAAPRFLGLAEDHPVDRSLLPLLFEASAAESFADVERLLDAPLRVEELSFAAQFTPADDSPPDLSLVLVDGGTRVALWLWVADSDRLPPHRGRFPAIARQRLGFRVTAGSRTLPLSRLKSLEIGDVIVTDSAYTVQQRPVTLWLSADLALHGIQTHEDRIMIEKRQLRRRPAVGAADRDRDPSDRDPPVGSSHADNSGAVAAQAHPVENDLLDDRGTSGDSPAAEEQHQATQERLVPPRDIDSLPIQVEIDVGTVELTVRELRELAPGSVLQLGRPLEAPAIVTVNGKMIATADLVDVNGQLGARLLTLVR